MRHDFLRAVIGHRQDASAIGHLLRLFATPNTTPIFPDKTCCVMSRNISAFTKAERSIATLSLLLAEWNDEIRMPNDEGSPNDRMTKAQPQNFGPFGLRHSFDIRHSTF